MKLLPERRAEVHVSVSMTRSMTRAGTLATKEHRKRYFDFWGVCVEHWKATHATV